ncbi:cobyric acid synthase [Angustibacter sp. Root456]|uniref:cobyric acid synthase n=1 Tax=Angustibacter sp. Root456 TaxID=1736539 RepID=UPI0006FB9AEA|nr:cobyric acid synthase [Angustibacter sp. Root456]KQX64527.1 cobalamin biosynthesis protein CobQ [Angustibacter sp. Root456]
MTGTLLVAGTTSDAGKTVVTTALCRALRRRGLRVAPFKAQNMSNNSMVTADGAEIGRAQWVQAIAAGAEPEAAMNPVLLKPGSDERSHVVVMGRPHGVLEARDFVAGRAELARAAFAAFDDLRSRYDVVVCEGAGSPAEINLRRHDYVNMGLARHADIPTLVVGDIDRGGVFAALYGTVALLDADDQALLSGFVINKFRGDVSLLQPGLDSIEQLTGRRVLGVLPWLHDLWLDSEDALALESRPRPDPAAATQRLRVAVVVLPRVSNFTDVDALCLEPDVDVEFVRDARGLASADVVVLPGTRATLDDLAWLRARGLADAVTAHTARGGAVLGICGGFQMLGREVSDPDGVEGPAGACAQGLGLLDVTTRFEREKVLRLPRGEALGVVAGGYEIHHGRVRLGADEPFLGGARRGAVYGTMWHGSLEGDALRRAWLAQVAGSSARPFTPGSVGFAAAREQRIDALADAVEEHLDLDAVLGLVERGAPPGLPVLA